LKARILTQQTHFALHCAYGPHALNKDDTAAWLAMSQLQPVQFRSSGTWSSNHRTTTAAEFSSFMYHVSHQEKPKISLGILGPTSRQQNPAIQDGQVSQMEK
jgi:hypothetical protein